ncbi:hypothetical protein [Phaeobacter inhibens]|uniref:hypothetical protein n=1 Tax=Phaeobacter inhibens TaxID=221822 RepID=UPI0021A5FDAC|nr:hypothetical protein [Phaeobacter inhibens]UWR96390.1 hypothetical protein K4K99_00895 [Phaeobacter inhibens]
MQKTLITAATVFALVMSAGASMAGPLNGHGFGGNAHDVRTSVSQALNNAARGAHTHQTDPAIEPGQEDQSSTEPLGTDKFTINFENHSGGQNGTPVIFWSPK